MRSGAVAVVSPPEGAAPRRASPPKPAPAPKAKRQPKEEKVEEPRGLPGDYIPSVSWAPDVVDHALKFMEDELQLPPLEAPDPAFYPQLPNDITEQSTSDQELGQLLGEFTAMCQYLEEKVAYADVAVTEQETILEAIKAEKRLLATGTVPDKTAIVLTEPDVVEATQEWLRKLAVSKVVKARSHGYERAYNAVSREIARRDGVRMMSGGTHRLR